LFWYALQLFTISIFRRFVLNIKSRFLFYSAESTCSNIYLYFPLVEHGWDWRSKLVSGRTFLFYLSWVTHTFQFGLATKQADWHLQLAIRLFSLELVVSQSSSISDSHKRIYLLLTICRGRPKVKQTLSIFTRNWFIFVSMIAFLFNIDSW